LPGAQPDVYLGHTPARQGGSDTRGKEGTAYGPAAARSTGTLDDLLAEVALTYPLTAYTAMSEDDEESALDDQILAALVSP
jgi:hypothetical protein